jgi:hypothetical protein
VNHVGGGASDTLLDLNTIVLAQVNVAEGGGTCPSVRAHEVALLVERLERCTHGHGRNSQIGSKLRDAHLTLPGKAIQDVVRAFFCTSHGAPLCGISDVLCRFIFR